MNRLRHPIRAIREPFGTAGLIVACIALVAALAGGAYAASALNGKQKKEVEKIAKKYAGKPGATGPAGSAGPQGTAGTNGQNGLDGLDGEDGKDGKDGAQGNAGKSVTNTEFTGAEGSCTEGGTKLVGTSTTYACNGKEGEKGEKGEKGEEGDEGSPWTAGGTLPSGQTETGSWSIGTVSTLPPTPSLEPVYAAISFPIPLAASLLATNVHLINKAGKEVNVLGEEGTSENCTGTVAAPTAAAGHLCVYTAVDTGSNNSNLNNNVIKNTGSKVSAAGAGTTGANMVVSIAAVPTKLVGTWAVTAP